MRSRKLRKRVSVRPPRAAAPCRHRAASVQSRGRCPPGHRGRESRRPCPHRRSPARDSSERTIPRKSRRRRGRFRAGGGRCSRSRPRSRRSPRRQGVLHGSWRQITSRRRTLRGPRRRIGAGGRAARRAAPAPQLPRRQLRRLRGEGAGRRTVLSAWPAARPDPAEAAAARRCCARRGRAATWCWRHARWPCPRRCGSADCPAGWSRASCCPTT
jgi:hypothetical protein